ncbi:LysE family translocator [Lentibacter sp. XHP0401]|uniref:LysE family translocator n=1 Tax=Lentibacter sp. XHP0401 TaxID=2984334 RepID=UPI0021E83CA2|nr:LysE family translocator [Lentibacter sp. XHP0401]
MEPGHLIAFNLAILAALASPGPAFLLMLRSAMSEGRQGALRTGLGLATAATLWTILALTGLTAFFAAAPAAYFAIKTTGALYLVWLAITTWRKAGAPPAMAKGALRGFSLGILGNLSNPKAVLFIAAIFATIMPQDLDLNAKLIVVGNHFLLEIAFYSLLAYGLGSRRIINAYQRAKRVLDRTAAVLLGALAARVAI